jgi:hypothetical protein
MGDAAHIHSPVGAQGMNTGLQDAYNLAWKLALVVSGRADQALLDSYQAERIPIAQRLLSSTDRAFSAIVSHNKLARFFRTRIFPGALSLAMHVDKLRTAAFRTISQTGIRYRGSPVSQTLPGLPADGVQAGDRFPWVHLKLTPNGPAEDFFQKLDDTRFTLVLVGQPAPRDGIALGDLLRIHVVPHDPANDKELARAGIPHLAFYLVRPDGYVGLAGPRLESETLSRYLVERLRFKSA